MKLTKKFAIGVAAAAALSAGSALAAYPEKPIKIMVGFLPVVVLIPQHEASHLTCTRHQAWVAHLVTL